MIDARFRGVQQFPYLTLPTPTLLRYGLMVGLPLCVLLTMLELGKGITAATPVAGEWRLEALSPSGTTGCDAGEILGGAGTLTVSQAGQFLTARRGALSLDGRITGDSVALSGAASTVTARVKPGVPLMTMEGTVAIAATGCSPVPFRAQLVAPAVRPLASGGRH